MAGPLPRRAPARQNFGEDQARRATAAPTRIARPRHFGLAAGDLQRRIDGDGQGARLAGDVGDEGDRRAELSDRAGEAEHRAGQHAGQAERQGDGPEVCQRDAPSVRAAPSSRRSTASTDSRIARTISGKAMIAAASAAPVQRNMKVRPSQSAKKRPAGPLVPNAMSSSQPVTTGGRTSGR